MNTKDRPRTRLADLIRTRRMDRGLTQKQLAEAIGKSYSLVLRIESGHAILTKPDTVDEFAAALDLSPDEIYVAERRPPPDIQALLQEISKPDQLRALRDALDGILRR